VGWAGPNADICYTAQATPGASAVDCNGARACETAAQVCPSQPQGSPAADCDNLCQAKNASTCTNQIAPVCNSVTPTPSTQSCNQGVCNQTINRCNNGAPLSCPAFTAHPNYNVNDTCDGLDNDCDGVVDDGAVGLCSLPNAVPSCGGVAGCQVSSCTGTYLNPNGLNPDGCECLPEAIGANTCAAALAGAALHTLSEGQSQASGIIGNLDTSTDGDWYRVTFNNSATQGYRPQVSFLNRASTNIVFDVYQDNCATTAPGLSGSRSGSSCDGTGGTPRNISTYVMDAYELTSQCTGPTSNGTVCNGAPSRSFLIWVHRAGAVPTCATYTISVSNG
jgi:hypothetical protein